MSKAPKYHNRKTTLNGIVFDSALEARRWQELLLWQRGCVISGLERQVPLVIVEGVKLHGATRARPPIRLIVDFVYVNGSGETIYEDAKGYETPASLMKRHLLKALHGIDVRLST
jgi:hypothetical protein